MKAKKSSKIFVLPTDTLYGICTSAFDKKSVQKIYDLKGRDENKPFIILISKVSDLEKFGIEKDVIKKNKKFLDSVWPGKVSVILPLSKSAIKKYTYLHRGTNKLAFRLPRKKITQTYIKKYGPLVAPSANTQGKKPSENIKEAKKYFGDSVDLYVAGGRLVGKPSTILEITTQGVNIVRQGAKELKL
ncbi:threonylcarbamoyl-AMP synthase [Candidatus Nomurabacteria bacterium]|nr:threonylcarbamoyl-AMP synthase [Candidatus Nomurabacteria bacterium]MCB9820579.1 threonylcarbamoyl-AMP synthase [Candidatus Nomurabacteria bacterium]